jgi:hypothetical protein
MGPFDPREVLRFGVRYPDGRVADSLADGIPTPAPLEVDGTEPRLLDLSGGGGDRRWEQDMFLAPLPPDGSLELVCEWPAYGIAESRAFVDLTGLAEAVGGTVELWPHQPEEPWTGPRPRLGEPGEGFFRPILDDPE